MKLNEIKKTTAARQPGFIFTKINKLTIKNL